MMTQTESESLPEGAIREIEGYWEYCITCQRWEYHHRYEFAEEKR